MTEKLISQQGQVFDNIGRFQTELANSQELRHHLGFAHAWYVDARVEDQPLFGFSKFIGYQKLDAKTYLKKYNKGLDGRNTEWALKNYCQEVDPESTAYQRYYTELTEWLGDMGKKPRKNVRILVLKPEPSNSKVDDDCRLLNLLKEVVEILPIQHRQELRKYL